MVPMVWLSDSKAIPTLGYQKIRIALVFQVSDCLPSTKKIISIDDDVAV
jgi:hypothetical protein